MVPRNEAISCSCSVDIDGSAQSVHVGYEPLATSTSCGLRFKIGSNLFTCAEVRLKHIIESFSQLEFSKTSFDASACFILFIGKNIPLHVEIHLTSLSGGHTKS